MRILSQSSDQLVVRDSGMFLSESFLMIALFLLFLSFDPGKHGMLFGAGFFGLFAAAFYRKSTFTFDAAEKVVRWQARTIRKATSGVIPFSDIQDITTETTMGGKGNQEYRLAVLTPQGPVPMSTMYSGGRAWHQSMRDEILGFLQADGVTAQSATLASEDLESVRSLISQGRKIDAIKLLMEGSKIGLADAKTRVDRMEFKMNTGKESAS